MVGSLKKDPSSDPMLRLPLSDLDTCSDTVRRSHTRTGSTTGWANAGAQSTMVTAKSTSNTRGTPIYNTRLISFITNTYSPRTFGALKRLTNTEFQADRILAGTWVDHEAEVEPNRADRG